MTKTQKAIGYLKNLPISNPDSLIEFKTPIVQPTGHDLLVKVSAVSVNPIDISIRLNQSVKTSNPHILGFDGCGTVIAIGSQVSLFKPGDEIFYAGDFKRPGSNSEYQLVDERIVGTKPQSLSFSKTAAMPLTSLTAYEILTEKLGIILNSSKLPMTSSNKTILIVNGAGGVGSILIQLAKLAGLTVIATAHADDSVEWVKKMGADFVVDYQKNLISQITRDLSIKNVDFAIDLFDISKSCNSLCELIKPNGKIVAIGKESNPIDITKLKHKSASFSWEWMFAKSFYQTSDLIKQHEYLNIISSLIDRNLIIPTVTAELSPISVNNLKKAHKMIESHHMHGKIVISDWK